VPGDSYKIFFYWPSRQESAEACAARFATMLCRLATFDPVFQRWQQQGWTREEANDPFCRMPPDVDELARIFDAHRTYYDSPRKVWPERGFSMGAWNSRDGPPYGVSFTMGVGAYNFDRMTVNHVFLNLSQRRMATGQSWRGRDVEQVLLAIVEPWEAQYAVCISGRYQSLIPKEAEEPRQGSRQYIWPWAGWLTYLTSPYSIVTTPPDEIKTERFANGGMLATLCDEPFDVDNPRHLALAREMHEALAPAQKILRLMK
jgi:hypothetical protein